MAVRLKQDAYYAFSSTGHGCTFPIWAVDSAMVRSLENLAMLQNKLDDIVHTEIRRPGKLSLTIKALAHIQYVGLLSKELRSESAERRQGRLRPQNPPKVTSVSIRTHSASSLVHPPSILSIKAFAECRISALGIVPPRTPTK